MSAAPDLEHGVTSYDPVTPREAFLNRATLLAEVLAYEGEHPEDPWTPDVLARFGPDTTPPF